MKGSTIVSLSLTTRGMITNKNWLNISISTTPIMYIMYIQIVSGMCTSQAFYTLWCSPTKLGYSRQNTF